VKRCSKCGETKAVGEFNKKKAAKDGLQYHCKECEAKYYAENTEKVRLRGAKWYTENREKVKAQAAKLRAENPERTKAYQAKYYAENLEKLRLRGAKHYAENREKVNVRIAKYRAENPEKVRARTAKWRAAHPEKMAATAAKWRAANPKKVVAYSARHRARKSGAAGTVTAEQIAARWEVYGETCYICGGQAEATDHVKPLAAGGTNWPANLRPICGRCNSRKKATWPYDFAAARMAAA